MGIPRNSRTHPDDGIPSRGGSFSFDTPLDDGPFYVWVGGAAGSVGDLEVVPADQSAPVIYPDVPAGAWFNMLVKQVNDAGTTHDIGKLRWGR